MPAPSCLGLSPRPGGRLQHKADGDGPGFNDVVFNAWSPVSRTVHATTLYYATHTVDAGLTAPVRPGLHCSAFPSWAPTGLPACQPQ